MSRAIDAYGRRQGRALIVWTAEDLREYNREVARAAREIRESGETETVLVSRYDGRLTLSRRQAA